jgi:hypothetical protein
MVIMNADLRDLKMDLEDHYDPALLHNMMFVAEYKILPVVNDGVLYD